ncbi:MAG: potassium-transporting ATPase subunit C [Methylomonas sp.]|jgi:K+-transporting ATPase ATPase C chain
MWPIISKSILLLTLAVALCCGLYPFALWSVGQLIFPFQANGSRIIGDDGKPVGSLLIAQPFGGGAYFHPRPSAASYNAAASASSSLAASNYALRDRVARTIGPLAMYTDAHQSGRPLGPDLDRWFAADRHQPHIVAQWAALHPTLAQAWIKADPTHAAYLDNWLKQHPQIVSRFIMENPATPTPSAVDLAVAFFQSFSEENPGKFPAAVTENAGQSVTMLQPVSGGPEIQSTFFDLWREEHPNIKLLDLPGDLVTTSASGLDPHITLDNANYQLERVAGHWAADLKRDPASIRQEIQTILRARASAPFGGLAGENLINVLEVNLELHKRFAGK